MLELEREEIVGFIKKFESAKAFFLTAVVIGLPSY